MTWNAILTRSFQKHCRCLVFIQNFRIWFAQTNPGNNQSNSSYNSANVSSGEHHTSLMIDGNVQRETIVDLGQSTTQSRTDNVSGVHKTVQTGEVHVTLLWGNQISNHTIPSKVELTVYAWTMIREPANKPVTPLQTIKAVISGDIAWKREPRLEPINERMRKGLLPYLSLIGPIMRRPTALTHFRTPTD